MTQKLPEDYLKSLNMPDLCAKCGEHPGKETWPIFSRYDYAIKLSRTTYKKSRFFVPLCSTCFTQLEKDKGFWLKMNWLGGIATVVAVLLAVVFYNFSLVFLGLGFLTLVITFMAYFKRSIYWGDSRIGRYNGEHFIFMNQQFHRAFAEKNPSLAKKD